MPLDFPTSPALNEIYTFGGRSWIWNGTAWDSYSSGTVVNTLNGLSGAVNLAAGSNITLTSSGNTLTIASTGTGGGGSGISGPYVITINGLSGSISLAAGSNISITPSGNTLTFAYTGTGGGGGGSGNNFTESTTAPTPVYAGDRWFDTDEGNLYTAVTDDSGLIWVQLNAGIVGASGPQGNTGATGPVGDYVISVDGATGAVNLKPFIIAMATAL